MKNGYSNVHGIVVEAAELDAQRCEAYQVVCPNCREFVFKALRRDGDRAIHYLSHYRSDPEANRECELRVAARFSGQQSKQDHVEHEETLHRYLTCFSSMIDSMPMFQDAAKRHEQHLRISASKSVAGIRKFMRDGLQMMDKDVAELDEYGGLAGFMHSTAYGDKQDGDRGVFDDWDESRASGKFHAEPGFPRSVQVRVATDMLRTLLTKPAIPAWNELFSTAWMGEATSMARHHIDGEWGDVVKRLGPVYFGVIEGRDMRREIEALNRMPAHAPYMRYGGTWGAKLNIELMHAVLRTLLELDYARWSRAHADTEQPAEIPKELRDAAVARYRKDVEDMKAAGIDISPEAQALDRAKVAEETSRRLDPAERMRTAMHMATTGEGAEYRHSVEEPDAAYPTAPVLLVVRFVSKSNGDYMPTFDTVRRNWLLNGQPTSPVPQTIVFDLETASQPYGTLARKLDEVAASPAVAEATLMLYGDDASMMALVADGRTRKFQMLMEQTAHAFK